MVFFYGHLTLKFERHLTFKREITILLMTNYIPVCCIFTDYLHCLTWKCQYITHSIGAEMPKNSLQYLERNDFLANISKIY